MAGHGPMRAWHGRHTLIIDKTDANLDMWHTRLVAGCREPASPIPSVGMAFMIMGQKWRIAPLTAHDHEKPNGWRRKLSTGEANIPCRGAGVAPCRRREAPQAPPGAPGAPGGR